MRVWRSSLIYDARQMTSTLRLTGAAALVLLLASLGCGICPLVPQPGPAAPWSGGTLSPEPTALPTLPSTLEPTAMPTAAPTLPPTSEPSAVPTPTPTREPSAELWEPVERGPIQPGETVRGTLPPGGTEVWYFDAQEGQYVTIRLDAVDSDALDPYLELHDEDGVVIAEDDDSGEDTNALIMHFPAVASATYYVYALTYSGEGDYALSLYVAEEPPASSVIEYGQPVEGMLAWGASAGWFFQGVEGDVITIEMDALDGELDCYLELYGPSGIALTDDDDSGEGFNALVEYYELPADGIYRIVAVGGLFGAAGTYKITVERTEMVVDGVLTYGEVVDATLEPGTRQHWLFEGEQGDIVTISMTAVTESMDTYLELFAPDGMRVMTDDDGGGDDDAEIFEFELPLGGAYRIIARGYDDDDVGEYELALVGP